MTGMKYRIRNDIEVNIEKGTIEGIVISSERGFFAFFGNEEDMLITWDKVRTETM